VSWERLTAAARRADVIYIGDYHALPSCQRFAAEMLGRLAKGRRRLILAVEMVFSSHQRLLDRYQAGSLPEAEFLRRIRYEQDWGYAWEGYRSLLSAARALRVPVVAADARPRGGLTTIRRRDTHAARRIAGLRAAEGNAQILVLFGESHLARGHLPRQLRRELSRAKRRAVEIVIVQNVESIYWDFVERGRDLSRPVELGQGRFVVFNASPLAKYEAYRQTLDRWRGEVYDDGRPDLSPTIHHILDLLLGVLGIDPYRQRLRGAGTASDVLVDAYPEVTYAETAGEVRAAAVADGAPSALAGREGRAFGARGARYVAASNTLFLRAFDLSLAAEEACRFLLAVFAGEAGRLPGPAHTRAAAGGAALQLERTLMWVASKLVDPSRRAPGLHADPVAPMATGRGALTRERTAAMLGQRIYEALQEGRFEQRELRQLFMPAARNEPEARRLLGELERMV